MDTLGERGTEEIGRKSKQETRLLGAMCSSLAFSFSKRKKTKEYRYLTSSGRKRKRGTETQGARIKPEKKRVNTY